MTIITTFWHVSDSLFHLSSLRSLTVHTLCSIPCQSPCVGPTSLCTSDILWQGATVWNIICWYMTIMTINSSTGKDGCACTNAQVSRLLEAHAAVRPALTARGDLCGLAQIMFSLSATTCKPPVKVFVLFVFLTWTEAWLQCDPCPQILCYSVRRSNCEVLNFFHKRILRLSAGAIGSISMWPWGVTFAIPFDYELHCAWRSSNWQSLSQFPSLLFIFSLSLCLSKASAHTAKGRMPHKIVLFRDPSFG